MLIQALAEDPSLKDQLSTIALLAPALHVAHMNVPFLNGLAEGRIDEVWHASGIDIPGIATHNKYFPGPSFSHIVEHFTGHTDLCRVSVAACNDIGKIIGVNVGDPKNLDPETMALAFNVDPGGSSFHLVMHYAQRIRKDTLQKFDYGKKENPRHYNGSTTPPFYDLSKINGVKIAMWVGSKDLFVTSGDVNSLMKDVASDNFMPASSYTNIDTYAHFDFVWGKDAHTRLYPGVISALSQDSDVESQAGSTVMV